MEAFFEQETRRVVFAAERAAARAAEKRDTAVPETTEEQSKVCVCVTVCVCVCHAPCTCRTMQECQWSWSHGRTRPGRSMNSILRQRTNSS